MGPTRTVGGVGAGAAHRPQRLIIAVDHNQELLERCRQEWTGGRPDSPVEIVVVANPFAGRLGSARNTALLHARADIVAFLDDVWRRCFYVNRSKVGAYTDMGEAGNIGAELRFGVSVLLGLGPALLAALSGRPERLVQALVAVGGLKLAGSGYIAGRAQLARGRRAEILTTGLSAADVERARVISTGDDA